MFTALLRLSLETFDHPDYEFLSYRSLRANIFYTILPLIRANIAREKRHDELNGPAVDFAYSYISSLLVRAIPFA